MSSSSTSGGCFCHYSRPMLMLLISFPSSSSCWYFIFILGVVAVIAVLLVDVTVTATTTATTNDNVSTDATDDDFFVPPFSVSCDSFLIPGRCCCCWFYNTDEYRTVWYGILPSKKSKERSGSAASFLFLPRRLFLFRWTTWHDMTRHTTRFVCGGIVSPTTTGMVVCSPLMWGPVVWLSFYHNSRPVE